MKYTYFNPTAVEFGEGKIESIVNYIDKNQKILVVYGGGSIKKNGVFEQVSKALEGYTWFEFGGVEPNPSVETLNKAVNLIKEKNIDFVLAVGGGSVIDGSKYLVASAVYDGDGWDFLEGKTIEKTLPLGAILTIPATGSESNGTAVISKKSTNEKRYFGSSLTYPKFAVLDPTIMSSLDDRQLANGLVDAFVHTCEQYLTYPNSSLLHDGYAHTILRGLHYLSLNWQNRKTLVWQENLMLLANQALNGFIGSGVPQDWATHMIGHEITAFYGLDHARSLAVVQPHLLRVMMEDKKDKLTLMGKEVFDMPHNYEMVVEAIEYMYKSIGVSTKLKDYDVDDKVIENITGALKKHGMSALGEKGNLTIEKVEKILKMSLN